VTILAMPGVSRPDQPANAQPVPEVVAFIEGVLARAKNGEITSIAVAYATAANCTGDGFAGGNSGDHALFAAIADLFYSAGRSRWERGYYPADDERDGA